jgi:thioester reductase-like protein
VRVWGAGFPRRPPYAIDPGVGARATAKVQFVTGYPGFIAKRLVRRLVEDAARDGSRVFLLVQPKNAAAAAQDLGALGVEHAEIIEGDVEQMHLGLAGREWKALAAEITDVWHLAARTGLSAPLAELRRVNVEGTRNVLELAAASRRLSRLNHFSTAYVSGDRVGVILEDELAMGQRFHNRYEETKQQAELLVRRAQAELPATIYRPSIVVGDSRTGEIDRFEGPYALAILLVASPLAVPLPLPGDALAPLNVVPVNFVVDAVVSIASNPAGAGRTIHVVDPSPLSARRVYEMIAAHAGKKLPPVSVPARAVQALLQLPFLERLSRVHRPAIEYVNHLAIYNCRHLLELLDGTGIHCPPITSYLDRLIDFVQGTFAKRREAELAQLAGEADDPLDPRPASP